MDGIQKIEFGPLFIPAEKANKLELPQGVVIGERSKWFVERGARAVVFLNRKFLRDFRG